MRSRPHLRASLESWTLAGMMKRSEGYFKGYQDIELFFQTWECEKPKGWMIITHGLGEHSECYNRTAEALAATGWSFFAWDLRGHGRSQGQRGYVGHFSDYVQDFEMLWSKTINKLREQGPVVFFAHSMGALIQLKSLAEIPQGLSQTQILSSPFLEVSLHVPPIKTLAAKVFEHVFPFLTLSNEILDQDLSRDPDVLMEYHKDPYRHRKISPALYLGGP